MKWDSSRILGFAFIVGGLAVVAFAVPHFNDPMTMISHKGYQYPAKKQFVDMAAGAGLILLGAYLARGGRVW